MDGHGGVLGLFHTGERGGFAAAYWRRPKTLARLDEYALGGRQFGTWITWFLVGGDFYTAYAVVAMPALV